MAKRQRKSAGANGSTATAKLTPRDKNTLKTLRELADGVVTAADKKRDPFLDVPCAIYRT